ncbi:MAG: chloride channel protein, partial [Nocardioidaceae bacterium]
PALYGMVAMGAVFASAAQAPLTSMASVVEMTGDFAITLPVMLAVAISSALARRLTYGTIYTTKLLRRGTDIERPTPSSVFHNVTVAQAMQPLPTALAAAQVLTSHGSTAPAEDDSSGTAPPAGNSQPAGPDKGESTGAPAAGGGASDWSLLAGPVLRSREPQALFSDETLNQALRQLVLYGRDGLPVVAPDTQQLIGWITNRNVLTAVQERLDASATEAEQGELAADFAAPDPQGRLHTPGTPLTGYQILEITITSQSTASGRRVDAIDWPLGSLIMATTHLGRTHAARHDTTLAPGDRITVLTPSPPPADTPAL